ncbi:MAG: YfiR family protein [Gammaproteobacteria bacterium]|nr:YfiR family protein [Gammaproteobacteria bacterium]
MSEKTKASGYCFVFVRQDGDRVRGVRFPALLALSFFFIFSAVSPLIASSVVTQVAAQPEGRLEAEIKAAFLYHFGAYVDWPPGTFIAADDPLVIGVTDADVIGPLMEIVRTRTIRNRPLSVKRVRSVDDVADVDMLYVTEAVDPEAASALLGSVRARSVLTITDSVYAGTAIITFVLDQDRVRFDVSLPLAEASDLRVSARLLSVARHIEEADR